MLPRSAGKPVLIGLSAAAVLAAGAVPVLAAAPAAPAFEDFDNEVVANEDVTVTTTLERDAETASWEGMKVTVTVSPSTELVVDCPGDIQEVDPNTCELGTLTGESAKLVQKVGIDDDITETTKITLTVTLTRGEGEDAESTSNDTTITFMPIPEEEPPPPPATKTPSPSPSPTKSSSSGGGSDNDSDDDDSSDDSDSSSGSSSSGSSSSGSGAGSSYTPPLPNGSLQAPPQVTS
ncbi:hypothetical protein ACFQ07_22230, partial [Actinomadura adrarensis]